MGCRGNNANEDTGNTSVHPPAGPVTRQAEMGVAEGEGGRNPQALMLLGLEMGQAPWEGAWVASKVSARSDWGAGRLLLGVCPEQWDHRTMYGPACRHIRDAESGHHPQDPHDEEGDKSRCVHPEGYFW